jgi:cobalt-zinc-cadmium efflux system membrane fusion protein
MSRFRYIACAALIGLAAVCAVFVLPHSARIGMDGIVLAAPAGDDDPEGSGEESKAGKEAGSPDAEPESEPKEPVAKISPELEAKYGIKVEQAGPGKLVKQTKLPGEIRLNADRVARVVPRLSGIVSKITRDLGDAVHAGEVLAVVESRELAAAKTAWLTAKEKVDLAQVTYDREKRLWEDKISAEQDFLNAKQTLAQAGIDLRSAEQQLRALGLGSDYLRSLPSQKPESLTRFEVTSPIDGSIIEKRVVLGDSVQADTAIYIVADLSTVWVDFSVAAKDITTVHVGQKITITAENGPGPAENQIAYVGPLVEQETRAALARVVLANENGQWKPGMFVTGLAAGDSVDVELLVPRDAVQQMGGVPNLFVKTGGRFRAAPVVLGRGSDTHVEILSGIEAGQSYAAGGVFMIKSELEMSKAGEE